MQSNRRSGVLLYFSNCLDKRNENALHVANERPKPLHELHELVHVEVGLAVVVAAVAELQGSVHVMCRRVCALAK